MAYLVSRDFACERLRLGLRQSYRILPPDHGALISTDEILDLLNSSRRPSMDLLLHVPEDIVTADELVTVPELANSGLTAKRVLVWTRRTKKVPPHFRLNSHTIRFSRKRFIDWLQGGRR